MRVNEWVGIYVRDAPVIYAIYFVLSVILKRMDFYIILCIVPKLCIHVPPSLGLVSLLPIWVLFFVWLTPEF